MKKICLLISLFVSGAYQLLAQDLRINQIAQMQLDLTARTQPRMDANGKACALLKIYIPSLKEAEFEGNIVETSYDAGEYKVYIQDGTQSITVKHPAYSSAYIDFQECGVKIEEKNTYRVVLLKDDSLSKSNKGILNVISSPSMAHVLLDGNYVGQTPLKLSNVALGEHNLTIASDSCRPYDLKVNIEDGVNTPYRVKLLKVKEELQTYEENGLKGFKRNEEIIVPCKYENIMEVYNINMSRVVAWMVKYNGKWGLLDGNARQIVECEYDYMDAVANGQEMSDVVIIEKAGKIGLMNANGSLISECIFDDVQGFVIGTSISGARLNGNLVLLDRTGEIIASDIEACNYTGNDWESEGLIAIKKEGKWGFINYLGKWIIANQYDEIEEFRGGLAAVKKEGKWGYINSEGKMIIPLIYKEARGFYDGETASVTTFDDKYIKIKKPDELIDERIEKTNSHSVSSLSVFMGMNGKQGLADKDGNIVIPAICDEGNLEWQFMRNEGLYFISINGKYGLIDKDGKQMAPFEYEYCIPFNKGIAYAMKTDGKWIRLYKKDFVK